MTPAQFRKLALAFPGAVEGQHQRHADFRVGGKIFAGLTEDEARASLKLPPDVQASVLDGDAFEAAAGAWGRSGWTYARLATVAAGVMKELLAESYALVAKPKPKPQAKATPRAPAKKTAKKRATAR